MEREGEETRSRVRIHFANLVKLALADRKVKSVRAAGSIPPQLRRLWLKMEQEGVSVQLYDCTGGGGEQQAPDMMLQLAMLSDLVDYPPGIAVLLTGDGAGYNMGVGFHSTLERFHRNGWGVEVLSWEGCCNQRMRSWVTRNGVFIPLDRSYFSITFIEPSIGYTNGRLPALLDLSGRLTAEPKPAQPKPAQLKPAQLKPETEIWD